MNQDSEGFADILDLERKLKVHSYLKFLFATENPFCLPFQEYEGTGRKLIGSLNAASNITGVLTDTNAFSALLHSYGALACWDYATAGWSAITPLAGFPD